MNTSVEQKPCLNKHTYLANMGRCILHRARAKLLLPYFMLFPAKGEAEGGKPIGFHTESSVQKTASETVI